MLIGSLSVLLWEETLLHFFCQVILAGGIAGYLQYTRGTRRIAIRLTAECERCLDRCRQTVLHVEEHHGVVKVKNHLGIIEEVRKVIECHRAYVTHLMFEVTTDVRQMDVFVKQRTASESDAGRNHSLYL